MSNQLKAQHAANQANLAIAGQTNQAQVDIAREANQWNWANLQAQNEWNIQQWERENAYNDPSAQMERYIKAGINPVWALGNGDPGNAAHLESGAPQPAEVAKLQMAHMEPESDPTKLGNIVAASQNFSNSLQGFLKLGLEAQDVDTRAKAQRSQAALNLAEGAWKQSQTEGQNIFNNLNTSTFGTLVGIKQQEYYNLVKQGKLTDEETKNAQESRNQIIAMTDYTWKQSQAIIQSVAQAWQRLRIEQQNADSASVTAGAAASQAETAAYNAKTNRIGTIGNLYLGKQNFDFQVQKEVADLKQKSTSQLIELYNTNRGWLERNVLGNVGTMVFDRYMNSDGHVGGIERNLVQIQAIGQELEDRYVKNPTEENFKAFSDWCEGLDSLPYPNVPSGSTTTNSSVLNPLPNNPSESWLPDQ